MNSGGKPLPENARNALLRKAREMARHRKKRVAVNTADCEGVVTTEWKTGSMGSITGIQFVAEVVITDTETTVTYLVRDFDLEDTTGIWGSGSLEDIEQVVAAQTRPDRSRFN